MLNLEETFEKYKDDIYLSMYRVLNSVTGSLENPCYNPPVSSMIKTNIKTSLWRVISSNNDFDFSKYISINIIKKIQPYLLFRDETVWFLLLTSLYFFSKKHKDSIDKDISFLSGYLILLKYYTSLSNKHMSKFCDKTKAILALETLSEKSLFSTKNLRVTQTAKSILNGYAISGKIKNDIKLSPIALGMVYLINVVQEDYFNRIKDLKDAKNISKLIIILRSRISQSFKAYAQQYYALSQMKISSDETGDTAIANAIMQIVDTNSRGLAHIPEDHFKLVMQTTGVPIDVLKKMYDTCYKDPEQNSLVSNIINIFLRDGRHELLLKSESVYEWATITRGVVAIRSKYEVRNMLFQLIETSEELSTLYDEKSDSFKHKMLQAIGMIIGISIYDTLKAYNVSRLMCQMFI